MEELDDILGSEESTGPARDENGRFAPKETETGVEPQEAPQEPTEAQETVPPTEEHKGLPKDVYEPLKAVREENKSLKSMLESLQQQIQSQQQPAQQEAPPPPPSIWEDDQAALQHWGGQFTQGAVQRATYEAKMNTSEMLARQSHEDFDQVWEPMNQFLMQNPAVLQQAQGSAHPWDVAYKAYKNHQTMQELGATDVETLRAKIREELQAEMQQQPTAPNLPSSLADAQSARQSSNGKVANGPPSLEEILNG